MSNSLSKLENLSLVTNIFGDGLVIRDILLDWFHFLGGKPGEVVVVDYWRSLKEQLSDWSRHGTNAIRKNRASQV